MTEVVVILVVGLLVLGPDRLPGIAQGLGKAMREFRKATREIQTTLQVEEVRRTLRGQFDDEEDEKGARGKPPTGDDPTTDPKDELEAGSPPPPPPGNDPTTDPKDELPAARPSVGPGPRPRAVPRPPPAGAVATGVFRPLQANTRRTGESDAVDEIAASGDSPSLEADPTESTAAAAAALAAAQAEAADESRLRAYLDRSDRDADTEHDAGDGPGAGPAPPERA